MKTQVVTAREAVARIPEAATVALSGSGGGLVEADAVLSALEARFLETGHPRNLTVVHAMGIGDAKRRGLMHFAHEGLLKRVVGALELGSAPAGHGA